MKRIVFVPLIAFGILFALISFYFRMRNQQQLDLAFSEMDRSPGDAYQIFAPLMAHQGFPALGQLESAQDEFLVRLYDRCIEGLKHFPPSARAYLDAQQTIVIMHRMDRSGARDPGVFLRDILGKARASVPSLESEGSVEDWNAMLSFFLAARQLDLVPEDDRERFDAFYERVNDPALLSEIAWRDARRQMQGSLIAGFSPAGTPADPSSRSVSVLLPSRLPDADARSFQAAIGQSSRLLGLFVQNANIRPSSEIYMLQALLLYDRMAVRAAFLADYDSRQIKRPSPFIASEVISESAMTRGIPDQDQMYAAFLQGAFGLLENTLRSVDQSGLSEIDGLTMYALCLRSEILLERSAKLSSRAAEERYLRIMQQLGRRPDKTPFASEIERSLREHPNSVPVIWNLSLGRALIAEPPAAGGA